jgi:hypothetical protein
VWVRSTKDLRKDKKRKEAVKMCKTNSDRKVRQSIQKAKEMNEKMTVEKMFKEKKGKFMHVLN